MALEKPGEPAGRDATQPGGAASLMSGFLGAMDPDEELNVKAEAKVIEVPGRLKRQKVDHDLFFDNPLGFKEMIKTFPKISFKGKGREFDDLDLLLKHYQKWVKTLYPQGDNFEDFIYKARTVLSEKSKDKEGHTSDPKRQLHMFRHMYKSSSASLSSSLDTDMEGKLPHATSRDVSDDVRRRIEENRQRALQRKREREEPSMLSEPVPDAFEDIFDPMQGDEDEEDPFGHGGGLGSSTVQKPGPSASRDAAHAPATEKDPGSTKLSDEQRQRIEDNRKRALAKKNVACESTEIRASDVSSAVAVQIDAPGKVAEAPGMDVVDMDECFGAAAEMEEDDVFGFGGGLD